MTAVALLALLGTAPTHAYELDEHESTGRESFERACALVTSQQSPWSPDGQAERLDLVCGHRDTNADLFGQAAALAGDHAASPDELLTSEGRRKLHSLRQFLLLALGNDAHFHPEAPWVWSRWHRQALDMATVAAQLEGMAQIEALQEALMIEAFSAHFLHDSHASGHMGIDRAASTAGAAHTFHDHWNKAGRRVRDRDGVQWLTFGDGQLDRDKSTGGRRRLESTATLAVADMVRTFVTGDIDPAQQIAVWDRLPFELIDPSTFFINGLVLPSVQVPREAIEPVAAFRRPARTAWTFEVWSTLNQTFAPGDESGEGLSGLVLGSSVAFPIDRFPMRIYGGVGVGRATAGDGVLVDLGYVFPVGQSFQGAMVHDATLGAALNLGGGAPVSGASWHGGYRMDLEFGRFFLRGSAGPAVVYPDPRMKIGEGQLGWFVTVGAGYVLAVTSSGRI